MVPSAVAVVLECCFHYVLGSLEEVEVPHCLLSILVRLEVMIWEGPIFVSAAAAVVTSAYTAAVVAFVVVAVVAAAAAILLLMMMVNWHNCLSVHPHLDFENLDHDVRKLLKQTNQMNSLHILPFAADPVAVDFVVVAAGVAVSFDETALPVGAVDDAVVSSHV